MTELLNQVTCGDCLALLPLIPCQTVDMVMTSPPYAMQRKRQYGGIEDVDYPAWLVSVLEALRPALKLDASVIINIRSHVRQGQVSDYVLRTRLAIRQAGWYEPEELMWYKRNGPPLGHTERPRRCWEHLLWYSNTTRPFTNLTACGEQTTKLFQGYKAQDRARYHGAHVVKTTDMPHNAKITDVFDISLGKDSGTGHAAAYPLDLASKCIRSFSPEGGLILDPFAGSGTTGVACKNTGRNFIQFELSPEYCEIARNRLLIPVDLPKAA